MIRRFKEGDLERINRQDEQLLEGYGEEFNNPNTIVFEDKGKVLVIVCPLFYDEGCILSSLIARDCGYKSISLIREAKALIKMLLLDCDFIEISTQVGWRNAERLARVLGFEPDRLEKNFYNGIDFNIWRINR